MKLQIVRMRSNRIRLVKLVKIANNEIVHKGHPDCSKCVISDNGVCDLHGLYHGEDCDNNHVYKNVFYKIFQKTY